MKKNKLILMVLTFLCFITIGCIPPYVKTKKSYKTEIDDAQYSTVNEKNYNNKNIILYYASSKECPILYIPAYIDGYKVINVQSENLFGDYGIRNYEKVYFNYIIFGDDDSTSRIDAVDDNDVLYIPSIVFSIYNYNFSCKIYLSKQLYQKCLDDDKYNIIYKDGYFTYLEENSYGELVERQHYYIANTTYYFNYEDSPNEDIYFIDNFDEGIALAKPKYDPVREGYIFDGWYLEKECINKYDYNNTSYNEELELYAKWIKE